MYGQKYGPTLVKAAQKREKQVWANEKPKLDNGRRLKGMYSVDPDDEDYKEISKMQGPTWKDLWKQPCRAKRMVHTSTTKVAAKQEIASQKNPKRFMVEKWNLLNPQGNVWNPKEHEDRTAGKGSTSIIHNNLVHKFMPMPQAMKIRDGKAAVDKEWENLETIPAWQLEKVKSIRRRLFSKHKETKKKVHTATLMDICHLKNAEFEPKIQKDKGRVVLRGDFVKDDSGAYAVFVGRGSSASQVTAAKVMDVIARSSDCDGQAADAVSAYTQVKLKDAPRWLKIPKSECPDVWIRLPRHKWPNSWANIEDPVVPLERNLYGLPLAGFLRERQFGEVLLEFGWEKETNWECLFVHRKQGLF